MCFCYSSRLQRYVKGLASFCALITCDWICADKDEELPKKVILKV